MTLHPATAETGSSSRLGMVLLAAVAILVVMVIATAIFGVQQSGPIYDFVSDPAALSGLPF